MHSISNPRDFRRHASSMRSLEAACGVQDGQQDSVPVFGAFSPAERERTSKTQQ